LIAAALARWIKGKTSRMKIAQEQRESGKWVIIFNSSTGLEEKLPGQDMQEAIPTKYKEFKVLILRLNCRSAGYGMR